MGATPKRWNLEAPVSSSTHPLLPEPPAAAARAEACGVCGVRTVLIAAGGAAGAYLGALPVSVCLRVIWLLFPQLAWEGLLLFDLLRGLSVSHGDLMLVQSQSVWGRSHFASTAVLISQHGRFGHLHVEQRKTIIVAPLGGSLIPSSCKQNHLNIIQYQAEINVPIL